MLQPSQSLKVSIPIGLKFLLESALKLHPPNFKYNSDNFFFIASKIFSITTKNQEMFSNGMVPISAAIVRAEVGPNYRKYIDYLLDKKIIDTDRIYKVGKRRKDGKGKCYGFSFCKRLKNAKGEIFEIKKRSLIKRAISWLKLYNEKIMLNPTLFGFVEKMKTVVIDLPKAQSILDELVKSGHYTQNKANAEMEKCRKFSEKEIRICQDTFGQRIHTNLTSLCKHIGDGGCLTIDGEVVVGIDIRSSQPAILYSVAVAQYQEVEHQINDKYHIPEGSADKYFDSEKLRAKSSSSPFGHIGLGYKTLPEYRDGLKNELNKMKVILEKDIYDQFSVWWKQYYEKDLKRSTIKRKWFAYVFGELDKQDKKMAKIWRDEFPIINRMISDFKHEDYCFMSKLLQRMESKIVIDGLCPELNSQFGLAYFTVHDSVFVKKSMVENVKPIFERILVENNIVSGLVVG